MNKSNNSPPYKTFSMPKKTFKLNLLKNLEIAKKIYIFSETERVIFKKSEKIPNMNKLEIKQTNAKKTNEKYFMTKKPSCNNFNEPKNILNFHSKIIKTSNQLYNKSKQILNKYHQNDEIKESFHDLYSYIEECNSSLYHQSQLMQMTNYMQHNNYSLFLPKLKSRIYDENESIFEDNLEDSKSPETLFSTTMDTEHDDFKQNLEIETVALKSRQPITKKNKASRASILKPMPPSKNVHQQIKSTKSNEIINERNSSRIKLQDIIRKNEFLTPKKIAFCSPRNIKRC